MRLTLQQFAESRAAEALGVCGNLPALASYVNEATESLLVAFGETGPFGCWDKVVFRVLREDPYLTLPAQYARAANMDICRLPIRVQNEWMEMLADGIGLQTICECNGVRAAYDRGGFPTAFDLPPTNQLLRIYVTDPRDVGATVVFSDAKDQNGNGIYGTNGLQQINGFALISALPFVTSSFIVTKFSGIEKPTTFGDLVLKAVDATTGEETFLSRYTPRETLPSYRRYFLKLLPRQCCGPNFPQTTPPTVQITAMLKREWVPVSQPTDVLLVQSFKALKEECLAVKFGEMDSGNGLTISEVHHRKAVKLLNQQLIHYLGQEQPAINVRPYQTLGLESGGWGSCGNGVNLQMV